jgi:carboxymethylenebutenolidase
VIAENRTVEIDGVPHYLAAPAVPTAAGILLIPHVMGVDHTIRPLADGLAARGFTTLVWNPYPQLPLGAEFSFKERPPRPDDAWALASFDACFKALRERFDIKAVGAIGFCMGGRFGLLFAEHEPALRAVVAAYPSIPALAPGEEDAAIRDASTIGCPVQVLSPDNDVVTPPENYAALFAKLRERSAVTSVLHYPRAGHGFFHNPGPDNEEASRTTFPQIAAFFEAHLASR